MERNDNNATTISTMAHTEYSTIGKHNQRNQKSRFLQSSALKYAYPNEMMAYKVGDDAEDGFLESMGSRLENENPFLCEVDEFYKNPFADPMSDEVTEEQDHDAEDGFLGNMNSRLEIENPFLCGTDDFDENWFANPESEMVIEDYHELESEPSKGMTYLVEHPFLCENNDSRGGRVRGPSESSKSTSYQVDSSFLCEIDDFGDFDKNRFAEPESVFDEYYEVESGPSESTSYQVDNPFLYQTDVFGGTSLPKRL